MNEESMISMNGELVKANQVTLSPFNLGISVGLGIFETLIAHWGVMPNFDEHVDRLKQSATLLKFSLPSRESLATIVTEVIRANRLENEARVRVRLTIGAGEQVLSANEMTDAAADYLIVSAVAQQDPEPHAELLLVPMRCNEHGVLAGVKSSSYAENVLAFRYAVRANADEAIMLNSSGDLCECSMSNIFLVKDGEVLTPSLSSGCLPGVTRSIVIRLCEENGLSIRECKLNEDDLLSADEILITSSVRGVQPARMLKGAMVCPGDITLKLSVAYKNYIEEKLTDGAK